MDLNETIEGCKKMDRKSQEELYRHFYPAFFSLCKRFFADEHDILTALNNGMMRVFKHIHQFDAAKGDFFNWSYTTIRNAAIALINERKTIVTLEIKESHTEAFSYNPFHDHEWSDIYWYLGRLPSNTRYVCTLYYLEGFSIKEIASAIDMKEGTVKWHLSECRSRLKAIFENQKLNSGE
ncbi:sigma-70 family RNA polymerase sigma factor [Pseudoflavitalea sp. G-6-1-2]|uniref:RNA polymerase sigma factor n=1 Tax=Pseudoflavitalea sp. G-6-1-2 TaxID=2728841 RepID=UPI001469E51D|nr:sigma-70 family RNA polymerase sigma factor [Pseudoflavitalea sp. G-6-1-2]NML23124.1 sigma-70 family RNA polymerase sigma factor [Pseudoflavitalea sp. G-6-1-2]